MIVTPRAVVVAHRDRMVAEGIASALGSYPWLMPSAATTIGEVRTLAEKAADDLHHWPSLGDTSVEPSRGVVS